MVTINDISINILSSNRAEFIKSTINSILNQTIKIDEINVFDNFSKDNTIEILKSFKIQRLNIFENNKEMSFVENFRKAASHSNKKFTVIFHDDDIIHPSYLEFALNALNLNHNIGLICSGMIRTKIPENIFFKDYNFSYIKLKKVKDLMNLVYQGFPMCFPSCIYKTANLKKATLEKDCFGKIADRPIVYDSLSKNDEIVLFPGQFIAYRFHIKQLSNLPETGPFVNQLFALQKIYYDNLYLGSSLRHKILFLFSFYHYMSLDFKNFKEEFKFKQDFINEFVKHVNGKRYFVFVSQVFFHLKLRYIYKGYRLIKRNLDQYS
jgi:glycosyltransferase involved in cell wall biosynthesis